MDSFQSISMLMIVRPLTLRELPRRGEHAISDNRHHPRLCTVPIHTCAASAAHLPAPRNLEADSKRACRGEANSRIPQLNQTEKLTIDSNQSHKNPAAVGHHGGRAILSLGRSRGGEPAAEIDRVVERVFRCDSIRPFFFMVCHFGCYHLLSVPYFN